MSVRVTITSRLDADSRAALEALLFFNTRQHHVRDAIETTIQRYGIPEIIEHRGTLRVQVAGLPDVQSLFAVRESDGVRRLVGAVIYVRDSVERFTVVHVGIAEDSLLGGASGARQVLMRLMQEIRRVARQTTGVRHVELAYQRLKGTRNSLSMATA